MADHLDLPARKRDAIASGWQQLGLTRNRPTRGDHVLVIGTGRHSNLIQVLGPGINKGRQVGHIVLAAASRCCPLRRRGRGLRRAHAPGIRAISGAARDAFGLDIYSGAVCAPADDNPHRDGMVWRFAAVPMIGVPITRHLERPAAAPFGRRSSLPHTLGMQDSTCLLVTGQPFRAYQNFDALRTLALPSGYRVGSSGLRHRPLFDRLGELDRNTCQAAAGGSARRSGRGPALLERIEAGERLATVLGGDGA